MTIQADQDKPAYLAAVEPDMRRADARTLRRFLQWMTGFQPKIWGGSMPGDGCYDCRHASGHKGNILPTGFASRKSASSAYVMPGYAAFSSILLRLGKHRIGASCLDVNRIVDIDLDVLTELIQAGRKDLGRRWTVQSE